MSTAWFVIFILLWTGFLAGTASLVTSGRVQARFAQLVWRGAAGLAVLPLIVLALAGLMPSQLPSAIPDLPYVEPAAGAMSTASTSLNAAVSSPEWSWTAPALLGVLIAGWLVRIGMTLAGQVRLQILKSRSVAQRRTFDAFPLTHMGLERVPDIRLIPGGSPFIAGLARRVIYVPQGLERPDDLRRIAIHECVHLKRGDLVTRPLERLVADIFWFSPFAWMMRRELDFWREAVCDEIASDLSGDRIGYARTLAQAARISAPARTLPVSAFILPRKRSLPMRLNRLLETRPARSRPVVALGASLVALALTPIALAEVKQEATGEKTDGEAHFQSAVLISPKARVTSEFGERTHPVTKEAKFHNGTDIAAPAGTPVHTPDCGKVVYSGVKEGYGETVEIAFDDGSKMRFAQLEARKVALGDSVSAGTVIGTVGMSGKLATGPHLHLEHWVNGEPANPRQAAGLVLYTAS
ncbi:M23/M56 family metallopeptidase [Henriciella aquimarina]|uniref:M23/M56 family metallopeptidase n=1 Tax=Henriciella aquimarina TaxID=545261 RepID=UPI000A0013BE|nr:M23/M56 family metallopeptidase [Henriciella aquimarina]